MSSSTDCVKVAVRVRPFVPSELDRGCHQIVEKSPGQEQLSITGESYSKSEDFYTFNNVFMMNESQEEVYNKSVQQMIGNLFEGFNVTILAYGQTGSGKTHTMGTCFDGDWNSASTGIIPRALQDIFKKVRDLTENDISVACSCSFMELYCENLFDLLSGKVKEASTCDIREDINKGIFIQGLTEHKIADETQAAKFLIEGGANRTTGATAMNDVSSRSHAIFTINITVVGSKGNSTAAKFSLVDLAGSERSKKTKATGVRFTEGVKINEGLLALGNVISALGGGSSSGFVSYRDSKLTRLLQDSLGGNSMTLMIACVSPADYNIEETLSTLRYADRAKKIKNKPVKNETSEQREVQRLKKIIDELRGKLDGATMCRGSCINTDFYDQRAKKLEKIVKDVKSRHETIRNEFIAKFQELDANNLPEVQEILKNFNKIFEKFREELKADDANFKENETTMIRKFADNNMKTQRELQTLERAMKAKQELLDRESFSDDSIFAHEKMVKSLESELEELRVLVARRDVNATIVNMGRKHKISELEKELIETRKKCANFEKAKKQAEMNQKRTDDLKRELQQMKATRVQLIRQQQAESKRFKSWIASRDKEINNLTQTGRKLQIELEKKSRQHEKQQAVLKRKVDDAKAVNARLQDAIDRSRKVQSSKASAGDIRGYLDSELMVLVSAVDAKIAMQSLISQRGFLTEQLMNLRAIVVQSEDVKTEMEQAEEDLAMVKAQIAEIRKQVTETDVDEKLKAIPGHLKSAAVLNVALSHVMKMLLEVREDFTVAEMYAEDLSIASGYNEMRIEELFEEMQSNKKQYERMKLGMERDFMMKLSSMAENGEGDENYVSMSKQLCEKFDENAELKQRVADLEMELQKIRDGHNPQITAKSSESNKLRRTITKNISCRIDLTEIFTNISNTSGTKRMSNGEIKGYESMMCDSSIDWENITQPYYPYKSKQRKPFYAEF